MIIKKEKKKVTQKELIEKKNNYYDKRLKEYHSKRNNNIHIKINNKIDKIDEIDLSIYNNIKTEQDLLNVVCPYCNKDYISKKVKINRKKRISKIWNIKVYKDCSMINNNDMNIKQLSKYLDETIINRKCSKCKHFNKLENNIKFMLCNKIKRNLLIKIYGKEEIQDTIYQYIKNENLIKEDGKLKINN